MEKLTSVVRLRNAIAELEEDQMAKKELFKEQLFFTYDSLRPANMLRNVLKDITTSPGLLDNVLGATVGMATGYLSKKLIIGGSAGIFRKLIGSLLQYGITNLVAQHPDAVKSFGQSILKHLVPDKSTKKYNRER
jgi:hypothetical protein